VVIEENREEIELTQEIQALWLRAGRETNIHTQIGIYDQILQARKDDVEALSYKADAVLELGEPQWAINLCQQALAVDPECTQALYQLACAYTVLEQYDEAIKYLSEVLSRSDTFIEDVLSDKALKPLHNIAAFNELMQNPPARTSA
jgi:tetratricopeptide (TPR) repeat protein